MGGPPVRDAGRQHRCDPRGADGSHERENPGRSGGYGLHRNPATVAYRRSESAVNVLGGITGEPSNGRAEAEAA